MQQEILPLTSLRFVAAFYVFLFHIHLRWPLVSSASPIATFFNHGACGMSIFFILSGVVLGYRFNKGVKNYYDYAFSRLTRIYPIYLLAALLMLPWLFSSMQHYQSHIEIRYIFIILINLFLLQAWLPQLFTYWNDNGSWSISVEAFFYVCFPFAINRFKDLSNRHLFFLATLFYFLAAIPGLAIILFNNNQSFVIFYSIPIFRLSEFILGMLGGLWLSRGNTLQKPALYTLISFLCIYLFLTLGYTVEFQFITENWLLTPLILLLIISLASLQKGTLYRFFCNRLFVYLGHISYSFYSFQGLVNSTLFNNYPYLVNKFPPLAHSYLLGLLAFLILTVISIFFYHLIEVKFRHFLYKKLKGKAVEPHSIMAMEPIITT